MKEPDTGAEEMDVEPFEKRQKLAADTDISAEKNRSLKMADYKQLFKTTEYQNWLKVVDAIHITKTGLSDFVSDAAVKLRDKIINDIQQGTNLPAGTRCNKCNTCPEANCEKFRQMIKTYHRFHQPSWKNTNPNDWCTKPWEVAKCFFPGDGYRDKLNAQETEFNGIIGFILNSTIFDGQTGENLSDIKGNKFSKCRQFVNIVRHSATLELKDADRKDYITQLKNLLTSGAVLQNDTKACHAHGQLTLLENDKLTLTTDDIVKVIEDTLQETKHLISKANEVNREASNINANTRDLQTKLETLNDIYTHVVEDIEKQKQDAIKVIQAEGNTNVAKVMDQANVKCVRIQAEGNTNVAMVTDQANVECDRIQAEGNTNVAMVTDQADIKFVRIQDVGNTNVAMVTDQAEIKYVRIQDVGNTNVAKVTDQANVEYDRIQDVGNTNVAKVTDQANVECVRIQDVGNTNVAKVTDQANVECDRIQAEGNTNVAMVTDQSDIKYVRIQDVGNTNVAKVMDQANVECVRIQEAGDKALQDTELVLEAASSKFRSDINTEAGALCLDVEGALCLDVEQEIKQQGNTIIRNVERTGEHVIEKIKIADQIEETRVRLENQVVSTPEYDIYENPEDEIYEKRKQELRHALAHHYLTEHDSMLLSPLMREIDDNLTKFYTPLKMNKVDTMSVQTTENVNSYKSLFYNDDNLHSNIYIQGPAGMGKSTFCNKLRLVWSEKIIPEGSKKDISINKSAVKPNQVFSDKSIIREFDFVFSLALRNVQGECEIEKMIETEIINVLPDHYKYAGLLPTILDKERCLIILDGWDEWSYRSDLCKKSRFVPHRKAWSKTTVLTSTRPWKMKEIYLKDSEISTLINITGVIDSVTFIKNLLKRLNDKYNTFLDVEDFIRHMEHKQLEHFLDIPVVAMQLLWLWHSDHELGDSKCKIYINMLDMLFGRAVPDDIADTPNTGLPPCFENTLFLKQHKMLLDWLGSLAFHTLHSSKTEESLVFSEFIVKSHVKSTAALKTALTTGILSQHKSPSLTERHSHFSFLHKTFQEFLAAYYMTTHADESENIVQTVFQVYGQIIDIMDISELFIFVCGLNIEMSCKISDSVMKSFSVMLTNHIEDLHVSGGDYYVGDMTESLQEMILAGYKESISNGHKDPQLALHHVYYSGAYYRDIPDDDKIYRDRLVDRNIDKIVTLCARGCKVDVVKIQQILLLSSSTLSHILLNYVIGLTDACLDLFTNITLKSLHLHRISNHFDVKFNTSSVLYCHLVDINREVEHSVLSALTTAPRLHSLHLHCKNKSVMCRVLLSLPMLHTLHVYGWVLPAYLCQVLSTLSQLQRLTARGRCEDTSLLCQLPSTLSNLQYIKLVNADLGDNDILLPNSIQEIELNFVKMTCRSIRQLVDRLTQIPHKVTCTLCNWAVEPEEKLDAIVMYMQQFHIFEIHRYSDCAGSNTWFHFTKI